MRAPTPGHVEGNGRTREGVAETRSHLYLLARELLLAVPGLTTDLSQHCGATLALALSGSFRLEGPDGRSSPEQELALLPPPNRTRFLGPQARTLLYIVDVDTDAFRRLAPGGAEPPPFRRLDARLLRSRLPDTGPLFDGSADAACVDAVRRALIDSSGDPRQTGVGLDARIVATVRRMREACPETVSATALADAEGLSPGRLMHLFKQQTGVPLRRFALWLKTRRALWLAARASSITDVAPMAGFADAAHLSRTIHEMFGLWPSYFSRRRRVVMHLSDSEEAAERAIGMLEPGT